MSAKSAKRLFVRQADEYASGRAISNVDPVIHLFNLCNKMKWNHLPVHGGLYDQDPELLRKFEIIFDAIDRHERSDRAKQEAEQERMKKSKGTSRGSGRRRR